MGVSGRSQASAALPPWKAPPRYPFDKKLGGPQSRAGRCGEEKNLAPAGNKTPAVQPIACRYTDSEKRIKYTSILAVQIARFWLFIYTNSSPIGFTAEHTGLSNMSTHLLYA
jgi:hypothetical protein